MQKLSETDTQQADSNTISHMQDKRLAWRHVLIIVLFFLVSLVILQPQNIRPAGDSFSFAWMADHMHATGEYRVSQWLEPNPIFLIYYSQLFYPLTENHFTAQIISEIVLALAGLLCMYGFCRRANFNPTVALICTLAMWSCPHYMQYSLTFTTDIASMSLALMAMYFCTSYVQSKNLMYCVVGALCASFAILTRQNMVAVIPAMAIYLFLATRTLPLKKQTLVAIAALALPLLAMAYQVYHYVNPTTAGSLTAQIEKQPYTLFTFETLWRPMAILFYTGLFVAPVILAAAFTNISKQTFKPQTLKFIFMAGALGLVIWSLVAFLPRNTFPTSHLLAFMPWDLHHVRKLPRMALIGLTGTTALFAGVILLGLITQSLKYIPSNPTVVMMMIYGCSLTAIHLIHYKIGDTYLIGFLPFMLIIAAMTLNTSLAHARLKTILPVMVMTTVISIFWVNLSLIQPSRMWIASERLVTTGVDPMNIDTYLLSWYGYHGLENYVAENPEESSQALFKHVFADWIPSLHQHAHYAIRMDDDDKRVTPDQARSAQAIYTYKTMFGISHTLYSISLQAAPQTPQAAPTPPQTQTDSQPATQQ